MQCVVVALITFVNPKKDTFCMLFFIGIDGRERNRYVNARFVLGRHYCRVRKIQ
jgi:hypothetical protein